VCEIYVPSFHEVHENPVDYIGTGNIPGIIAKLDVLQNLGFDAIKLSPFYPSPMVDGGYDVSDFVDVRADCGTLDDFEELVAQAHRRGIKVMIDLVPNHTSAQHPWFLESQSSHTNPKADWYIWRDPAYDEHGNRIPPNNWTSDFSLPQLHKQSPEGVRVPGTANIPAVSGWEWHETRGQYYLRDFAAAQPNLNWNNPEVRAAMAQVARTWLGRDVDGIRVDVANHPAKDPAFTDEAPDPTYRDGIDNPSNQFDHTRSRNYLPLLRPYLTELTAVVDGDPSRHMVLESWAETVRQILDSISPQASTFNFSQITHPHNAAILQAQLDRYYASLPDGHVGTQAYANHDVPGVATRLGGAAARAMAVMNLTLPGIIFVYQKSIGGFQDSNVPPELRRDSELGDGRDGVRTPMQWDSTPNAGFSQAAAHQLWLPVDPDYETNNLELQAQDPRSSFSLYRTLLHLRRGSATLRHGTYHPPQANHPDVLVFARRYQAVGERANQSLTVVNFSDRPVTTRLRNTQQVVGRVVLSSLSPRANAHVTTEAIHLQPHEAVFIVQSA